MTINRKAQIRKEIFAKRLNMSENEVFDKSLAIAENFKKLLPNLKFDDRAIFSIYADSYNEVCTDEIKNILEKSNIKYSYPRIVQKDHPLEFILAQENQKFISSKFYKNIVEPQSGKVVIPDFIILPLISFDKNLTRLGMGGGFFDRTIAAIKNGGKKVIIIALAYDFQSSMDPLPKEETDQSVDFIVTEKEIIATS